MDLEFIFGREQMIHNGTALVACCTSHQHTCCHLSLSIRTAVVEAIDEIGSKWRLVILHDLQDGEKRFNELKRSTGASSRTLSRVVDDLEEAGLVARRVEERPIASYYSLTEKGEALCPVLDDIEQWAAEWVEYSDQQD